jgi:hypothetical protein
MEITEVRSEVCSGGSDVVGWNLELCQEALIVTVICEKRCHLRRFLVGVVVCKFCERQPVELLSETIDAGRPCNLTMLATKRGAYSGAFVVLEQGMKWLILGRSIDEYED